MTIGNWKKLGKTFHYKNHSIFYIHDDYQAKETILFIHGFPTSSWDWWKIRQLFSKDRNLLFLDMIGFGYSDKPTNYNYNFVDQTDLIFELLKYLEISNVHILSHDYGVSVGQEIIFRKTSGNTSADWLNVQSICFTNGGLLPGAYKPKLIQKILASALGNIIWPFLTKRTLGKTFRDIFGLQTQPSPEDIDNFWALISEQKGQRVIPKIIQYMKERYRSFDHWVKAMQETKIPMRLINGNYDSISGKLIALEYEQLIPDPDVINLTEIGHYPNFEAPVLLHRHYQEFLNNLCAKT